LIREKVVQNSNQDVFSFIGASNNTCDNEEEEEEASTTASDATNSSASNENSNNLFYALRMSEAITAFVVVSLDVNQTKSQTQKQFKSFSKLCHEFLRSFGEHVRLSKIWSPEIVGLNRDRNHSSIGGGGEDGARREGLFKFRESAASIETSNIDRRASDVSANVKKLNSPGANSIKSIQSELEEDDEDFFDSVKSFFANIFSPSKKKTRENTETPYVGEPFEHPQGPPGTLRTPRRGHHMV